ncbi:MAG: hypothetical protein ACYCO0_00450 [Candidatus Micrarchaeaceae archaeon]
MNKFIRPRLSEKGLGNEVPVNFITIVDGRMIEPEVVAPIINLSQAELKLLRQKDPDFAAKSKLPVLRSL